MKIKTSSLIHHEVISLMLNWLIIKSSITLLTFNVDCIFFCQSHFREPYKILVLVLKWQWTLAFISFVLTEDVILSLSFSSFLKALVRPRGRIEI